MHANGVDATSMDDVLKASGAGKSQMYHYFAGKEELVAAVLHFQFGRIMVAQSSLWDDSCADILRWRQEVLDANERSGFSGCPLGAFAGQLDGSPELSALFEELFARWQNALAALVARATAASQLRPPASADEAALVLLGSLEGGSMLSRVRRRQDDLRRTLDAALAAVGAVR
jgi:TetR/AcrR family transcriptional regulator, transcriptional repressor for nem operon